MVEIQWGNWLETRDGHSMTIWQPWLHSEEWSFLYTSAVDTSSYRCIEDFIEKQPEGRCDGPLQVWPPYGDLGPVESGGIFLLLDIDSLPNIHTAVMLLFGQ